MVTSEKSDVSRVFELQAQEKLEGLDWIVASINKITHEDVAGVRYLSSLVKEFEEVMELTVDITANSDRSWHWLDVAFFNQDLLNLFTEDSEISLW